LSASYEYEKDYIFIALQFALLIFGQIEVFACGCPGSKDTDITMAVTQHFGNASIVFSGKVIAKEFVPIIKEDTSGKTIKAENLVYKFLVGGWWKGKSKDEITLNTDWGVVQGCPPCVVPPPPPWGGSPHPPPRGGKTHNV
jgi:hypothetical protein